MMKFLVDENVGYSIVNYLRNPYLSKIIFIKKDKVIRLTVSGMDNVTKVSGK